MTFVIEFILAMTFLAFALLVLMPVAHFIGETVRRVLKDRKRIRVSNQTLAAEKQPFHLLPPYVRQERAARPLPPLVLQVHRDVSLGRLARVLGVNGLCLSNTEDGGLRIDPLIRWSPPVVDNVVEIATARMSQGKSDESKICKI